MKTQRKASVHQRASKSEWLSVVDAIDRLLKTRISDEDGFAFKDKRPFGEGLLASVNVAYAATLRYYVDLLGGGLRNPKAEAVVSKLWKEVGRLIRHYDADLSARLTDRKGCWSQEATWSTETIKKAWIALNAIRVSVNVLRPDRRAVQRWSLLSPE